METPAPKKASRFVKYIRRAAFVLVVLITLGALFVAEENWRGVHAWTNYKKELEAKGEHFDIASVVPPRVPDDQNLALIPYFTGSGEIHLPKDVDGPHRTNWTFGLSTDLTNWARAYGKPESDPAKAAAIVLEELNKREPLLADLKMAARRPQCGFNADYDHWADDTNVQARVFENFSAAKGFIRVLSLKADAELTAGQTGQALADIGSLCKCVKGLIDGPLLISQLVGFAGTEIMLQPVAQGLVEHRWTDAQLKQLQGLLGPFDLLASSTKAVRGERNICSAPFFNSHYFVLPGWNRMEEFNLNRMLVDSVMPCIDAPAQRINLGAVRACQQTLDNLNHASRVGIVAIHHTVIASSLNGTYPRVFEKIAHTQTSVSEVLIAIALERCKLAEGKYPASLASLVPRYASALPHDVITGQPFIYRLGTNGQFILYSVGWNGIDDGGKTAFIKAARGKGTAPDLTQGDWVFQYPD